MKISCTEIQELLAEEEFSPEIKEHIGQCYRCSNIASGLSLLDRGLSQAVRLTPPKELNQVLLDNLDSAEPVEDKQTAVQNKKCNVWAKYFIPALSISASLVLTLVQFNKFSNPDLVTESVFNLAHKSLFDLMQLGIVSVGLLCLCLTNTKKVLICGLLFLSMIIVQVIKMSL